MELKWLEDFVSLATTLSFSRSAQERCVTQSTFSRRIKQLEQWLGTTLVSRVSFPAELTRDGRLFLPVARETIETFYATRRLFEARTHDIRPTLTFSALHTLAVTFFPAWLCEVSEKMSAFYPRLCPDHGGIEDNINTLVEGEVDFLLTYAHESVPMLLDQTRFPRHVLGTEQVWPVCASPARERPLDRAISEHTALDYLSYGGDSFFGVALARLFRERAAFERNDVYENTIAVGLKAMAMAGWGVAWLPESLIRDELAAGTLSPASDDPAWRFTVDICIYRNADATRPVVDEFWAALRPADAGA
ncbi:LysR family transcriptional regulator [Paraburkholderia unamae]|uniref:LysR family transcriptional regulator n=1 Tax=Paraburkholderia unamae TaxID=219649 RepID=UPI000DC435FC|nr:LysR substrate-binding domain-containing protein [Paraburkholderia unamae]RAR57198.1 LysR family transcriptional regulator [Paraburkholderia unamae]CAG9243369.1 LysR family transcriptional regulator [Paraburkholderia unamae]